MNQILKSKNTIRKITGAIVLVAVVLFASLSSANAASSIIDKIKKRGSIKVGMSVFVPWAFRDVKGNYVGYEIDIAKKLAKDLGVKLTLVPTNWDGIIPSLLSGKMDIIISGMSVTDKRRRVVDFTNTYGANKMVVVGLKSGGIKSLKDLNSNKYTFAVRRGSQPASIAKKLFPKAKRLQFDDDGISFQEVLKGGADFTIDTNVAAAEFISSNKDVYLLEDGKAVLEDNSAMALRKGDTKAKDYINKWIAKQKSSGFIKQRADFWFNTTQWKSTIEVGK